MAKKSPMTNKNSKGVMFNNLKGKIQRKILSDVYNWLLKFFCSKKAHICLQIQLNEGFLFHMMMIVTYLFWALD